MPFIYKYPLFLYLIWVWVCYKRWQVKYTIKDSPIQQYATGFDIKDDKLSIQLR